MSHLGIHLKDYLSYTLVLSGFLNFCYCAHFNGMSISWKPNGTASTVDVNFRISYLWSRVFCNDTTIQSGSIVPRTGSKMKCYDGCGSSDLEMGDLSFYCTDYSEPDEYTTGINTITYSFPTNVDNIYRFGYRSGDWRVLLEGSESSWSVLATANLTVRPDTGDINNSPVTNMPPVVKVQSGCNHTVRLPVSDAERDKITCRWASDTDQDECAGICDKFPNAILDENTCIIDYRAPSLTGYYAVPIQVEDYYQNTDVKMSSVPLQFLVRLVSIPDPCGSEPIFVDPTPADGACLAFAASYEETITSMSPIPSRTVDDIFTVSPAGFTKTAIQAVAGSTSEKYVNVSWTPTAQQLGPNIYCFYAVDSVELQSAVKCVTILAGISPPAVVPNTQSPNGILIDFTHSTWMIDFDTEFYKPTKTAYIKFYKANGTLHHQIDVSTANTTYPNTTSGRTLTINAQVPFDGFLDYYILLDEGVAVTDFCGAASLAVTDTNFWRISVDGDSCTQGNNNCSVNADCTDAFNGFTCVCKTGFTGDGFSCSDINECTEGTHSCHVSADCGNTIGSFTCTCKTGFTWDGIACIDINECTDGTHNCDTNADCSNTFGSFTCSCKTGYTGDGYSCTDVNECTEGSHTCHVNADCSNTFGSFTCACVTGFAGNGFICSDINECTAGTDNCHVDADCANSVGSYTCACKTGHTGNGYSCVDINECSTNIHTCHADAECTNNHGSFTCACKVGYSGNGFNCNDKNECTLGTHACDVNADCSNTVGSYMCTCNAGYSGNGFSCADINECSTETDSCHQDADCTNTAGSYTCACKPGYSGDGTTCTDVDECDEETDNCHTDADCSNTIGSFTCACKTGFSGNGFSCLDINECTSNTDNCHADAGCTNTHGSFNCACNTGFSGDGVTCTDINECTIGTDTCSNTSDCTNNPGSYSCACWSGYTGNGHTCTEINECTSGTHNCSQYANCTNTVGSFTCTCITGYNGNGVDCYATMTTYKPVRVETKFSMALQTALSIPGNLGDPYTREYQTALAMLSQELTPLFQQRLGNEFVELEILSISDGGKVIEYAVTSTTKDSQWKVFNTAKDLVNGDEPFQYAGRAAQVEAARITYNDQTKLITPSNVNTFSCELYESLRPCAITEQCEINSGQPGCFPVPQPQTMDMGRIAAYITIPLVAAVAGFVATAVFCFYQRRKRRKEVDEKEELQADSPKAVPTMVFPQCNGNFLVVWKGNPGENGGPKPIRKLPGPKSIRSNGSYSGYNAAEVRGVYA